jgi:hypothetical protein
MRCGARKCRICGIQHDIAFTSREEMPHIGLKDIVLDQVIYDVQGKSQVGTEPSPPVGIAVGVIAEKTLGGILGKTFFAHRDGTGGNVKSSVPRVVCE